MLMARAFTFRWILILCLLTLTELTVSSCGKKPKPSAPPTPIDFALTLQYAQRAALVYEQDPTIQSRSGTGVRVSISGPLSDRKSTRLNSSHLGISYAVFCLKKK